MSGVANDTNKLLLIIIAILLPPVAVFVKRGFGGACILSIVLTFLIWLPGVIHALFVVLS